MEEVSTLDDSSSSPKDLQEEKVSTGGRLTRHALPPCKVCGAQAKGFHYGVNTCEACKGFFRRSVIRKEEYACLNDPQRCVVKPGMRKNCPACRYKRCMDVGMSLEAIRIGRYTTEKKNRDIIEIKAHENHVKGMDDTTKKEELYAQVIQAHNKFLPDLWGVLKRAKDDQTLYLKRLDDERKLFGVSKPICFESFHSIFKSTGIEVDDRLNVINFFMSALDRQLRKHVQFAKDLPGFKTLQVCDQLSIIKESVVESWMLTRFICVDTENGLFTEQDDEYNCTTFEVNQIFEDWGYLIINTVERLKKLNLTYEEFIMVKAANMFMCDRCELKERVKVEQMFDTYFEILRDMLKKNHPEDHDLLFRQLISVLVELRTLSHVAFKNCDEAVFGLVPESDKPPLLKEVLMSHCQQAKPDMMAQLSMLKCESGNCYSEPDSKRTRTTPTLFSRMASPVKDQLIQLKKNGTTNICSLLSAATYESQYGPKCSIPDGNLLSQIEYERNTFTPLPQLHPISPPSSNLSNGDSDMITLTDISHNVPSSMTSDGYVIPQLDGYHD